MNLTTFGLLITLLGAGSGAVNLMRLCEHMERSGSRRARIA